MGKGRLFKKSVGPSDRLWNNRHMATEIGGIICQPCGTIWPDRADGDGVVIDRFLGLQLIENCCGKAIDVLYEEFGEEFAIAFLEDFAENPTDLKFGLLRFVLPDILRKAQQNVNRISSDITETIDSVQKITDNIK